MEHDEHEQIIAWQQEAAALADKYGHHAAVSTFMALFDDSVVEFKLNPNPERWTGLIRSMYMLQHVKNNYIPNSPRWEQKLLQQTKDAEASLNKKKQDD